MASLRAILLDDDRTSTDGILTSSPAVTRHMGRVVATEGSFATCPKCGHGGPVYNHCVPDFTIDGAMVLVDGARVRCQCRTRPYVIPSQASFLVTVTTIAQPSATEALIGDHGSVETSRKGAEVARDEPVADDEERICPNMKKMIGIRLTAPSGPPAPAIKGRSAMQTISRGMWFARSSGIGLVAAL